MGILKLHLTENRIYGLDIIRAIAIIYVVIEHGGNLLPGSITKYQNYFLLDGVSIFFVLSGFLIGGILIKTLESNSASFKVLLNFWKRRWIRTLPNYLLVLFILVIISIFTTLEAKPESIYRYVFFIQNFNNIHPDFFPEAWSLSVEEWFYLLIPSVIFILISLTKLNTRKTILIVVLFTILYSIIFRYYRYTTVPVTSLSDWDKLFRKQVITRLDSIMFGVLAAYICNYHNFIWSKYKNRYFGLGIIIIILQKIYTVINVHEINLFNYVLSFSTNSIAIMMLLPYLNEVKTGKGLGYRIITYTSLISYSMYLLNLSFVQLWIIDKPSWFKLDGSLLILVKYILYWAFTIIGSILLYKYYELPFMRLRDKITKRDSSQELENKG